VNYDLLREDLKDYLFATKCTKKHLADRIRMSPSSLGRFLNGETKTLLLPHAKSAAVIMGQRISKYMFGTEEMDNEGERRVMEQVTEKKYKVFMFYANENGDSQADKLEEFFNKGWRIDRKDSLGVAVVVQNGIEQSIPVHMFILAKDVPKEDPGEFVLDVGSVVVSDGVAGMSERDLFLRGFDAGVHYLLDYLGQDLPAWDENAAKVDAVALFEEFRNKLTFDQG
jgi:transcriptional regulator with XRE-family HTH domain